MFFVFFGNTHIFRTKRKLFYFRIFEETDFTCTFCLYRTWVLCLGRHIIRHRRPERLWRSVSLEVSWLRSTDSKVYSAPAYCQHWTTGSKISGKVGRSTIEMDRLTFQECQSDNMVTACCRSDSVIYITGVQKMGRNFFKISG